MATPLDIVGVPSSMGAFAPGQERAPAALRAVGLVERLRDAGIASHDRGDSPLRRWAPDPLHPRAQNLEAVAEVVRETVARVEPIARDRRVALVLGGDCTVGLGTFAGIRLGAERPGLVYFDLHPDLNVPESVDEGAVDWMGMAHGLGVEGAMSALVEAVPPSPLLRPDQVWFLSYGPDNRTSFERDAMERMGLRGTPVEDVAADPTGEAANVLDQLEPLVDRLVVHLDVDVVDFTDLPLSENAGRNQGLTFGAMTAALGTLLASPALAAVTIAEVNPDHDPDGSAIERFVGGLVEAISMSRGR